MFYTFSYLLTWLGSEKKESASSGTTKLRRESQRFQLIKHGVTKYSILLFACLWLPPGSFFYFPGDSSSETKLLSHIFQNVFQLLNYNLSYVRK